MPAPGFKALVISDRTTLPGGDLAAWLAALATAVTETGTAETLALQLREKDLADRDLYELALRARAALPPPARLLVNGRIDVALAAGADGVHLPADGPPTAALRSRFGPDVLLGISTHSVDEVVRARRDGADYVVFGPVYPTPGKPRFGPPPGAAGLARAAGAGIPVYALGGVTLDRLGEVASAGAAGVAGIRLFQTPADLATVLRAVRRSFPADPAPQES